MAGKFEVYQDSAGKFRFRLKATNGQVIAVGQAYETKKSCLNGIDSIRTYPERVVWPGLAISITGLSVNYIGDGLRDALDPRIRGR